MKAFIVISAILVYIAVALAAPATPQQPVYTPTYKMHYQIVYFLRWEQNLLPQVKNACSNFTAILQASQAWEPSFPIEAVIGFGPSLWRQWGPPPYPTSMLDPHNFQAAAPSTLYFQATYGDIFVHCKSDSMGLCFYFLTQFNIALGVNSYNSPISMMTEDQGWFNTDAQGNARDLIGFIDGTDNPATTPDIMKWTLISSDQYNLNCSYVLAQKWAHRLSAWNNVPVPIQEQIIGRTKPNSVRLPIPAPYSHICKVNQTTYGYIYRQSRPYGIQSTPAGLLFVAYANDSFRFNDMLSSIVGVEGSSVISQLELYTTPLTSSWFFVPTLEKLAYLAD